MGHCLEVVLVGRRVVKQTLGLAHSKSSVGSQVSVLGRLSLRDTLQMVCGF